MKKNIAYLSVLIILLGVAYLSEEVLKPKAVMSRKLEKQLFQDFSSIKQIKINKITLSMSDDNLWQASESILQVNKKSVDQFLNVLQNIHISSIVQDKNISDFTKYQNIPMWLSDGEKESKYILGDVSPSTGGFYIISEERNEIYICYDESLLKDIYQNQLDLDLKKYLRLRDFLTSKNNVFYNKSLEQFISIEKTQKVEIDNIRNRLFSINLIKNTTYPKPPEGLLPYELKSALRTYLGNARIQKIINSGHNVLSSPVSQITFDQEKTITSFKLYASLNGEFGRYLKVSGIKSFFKLEVKTPNPFYVSVQDFWDKRHSISKKDISKLKKLDFSIFINERPYQFYVSNFETFEVKTKSKDILEISQTHINLLFNLLFNLVDFKSAKYIIVDDTVDTQERLTTIKLLGEEYSIGIVKHMLKVYETKSKTAYYYDYNTQLIEQNFFSNLFTVK